VWDHRRNVPLRCGACSETSLGEKSPSSEKETPTKSCSKKREETNRRRVIGICAVSWPSELQNKKNHCARWGSLSTRGRKRRPVSIARLGGLRKRERSSGNVVGRVGRESCKIALVRSGNAVRRTGPKNVGGVTGIPNDSTVLTWGSTTSNLRGDNYERGRGKKSISAARNRSIEVRTKFHNRRHRWAIPQIGRMVSPKPSPERT